MNLLQGPPCHSCDLKTLEAGMINFQRAHLLIDVGFKDTLLESDAKNHTDVIVHRNSSKVGGSMQGTLHML